MGAVGGIRNIRAAARAARAVMDHTHHSVLVGEQAGEFAMAMGLEFSDLTTQASAQLHRGWLESRCQPNFRKDVAPDAGGSCGPYSAAAAGAAPVHLLCHVRLPMPISLVLARWACALTQSDRADACRRRW